MPIPTLAPGASSLVDTAGSSTRGINSGIAFVDEEGRQFRRAPRAATQSRVSGMRDDVTDPLELSQQLNLDPAQGRRPFSFQTRATEEDPERLTALEQRVLALEANQAAGAQAVAPVQQPVPPQPAGGSVVPQATGSSVDGAAGILAPFLTPDVKTDPSRYTAEALANFRSKSIGENEANGMLTFDIVKMDAQKGEQALLDLRGANWDANKVAVLTFELEAALVKEGHNPKLADDATIKSVAAKYGIVAV